MPGNRHGTARERAHQWAAEGATTPESLRQTDRAGRIDTLESGWFFQDPPTEGVSRATPGVAAKALRFP